MPESNERPGKTNDPTMRDPESLTTDQVRQGQTGTGMRYVLLVSMVAAVIVLGIVFFSFS